MKKKDEIKSLLATHFPDLARKYYVSSIGLFGSVARNEFSDNSDIDILVDFSQPVGMEFIELAYELEQILKCKVDLVSKNGIKPHYFKSIEKDLIYV